MTTEIKKADSKNNLLDAIDIHGAETWIDYSGVEWDLDYVNRFERLRQAVSGTLIFAWDLAYEQARVKWTGRRDCWPVAMASCRNMADADVCLSFAQKHALVAMKTGQVASNAKTMVDGVFLIRL